ncbi:MAG: DUF6603 domain-containing protein [Pseudomonadota bacterium]
MKDDDPHPGPVLTYRPPRPRRIRSRRGRNRRRAALLTSTARTAAVGAGQGVPAQGISFDGLDPTLASLGILIGVLTKGPPPTGTADQSYDLNGDWFADPIANLRKAVGENAGEIAALLSGLMGAAAGQALGVPVTDPALLGTWYPLITPDPKKARGLYVVTYEQGGDQIFGLGVLGQFDVPSAKPVILLESWGLIPILRMGPKGIAPVVTESGFPISLGIAVEGAEAAPPKPSGTPPAAMRPPLFDLEGVSFDGVKVNVLIDIAKPSVDAEIVVLRLQLPGDQKPADRALTDLEALSAQQIQETVASLFVGALAQIDATAAQEARYLLPMIGISGAVPGQTGRLPDLLWSDMFRQAAKPGGDIAAPIKAWFNAVMDDPDLLALWLKAVGGAAGAALPKTSGSGSRADPMEIALADLGSVGRLSFTMASQVQTDGHRHVYPGLAFDAAPQALGTSSAVLRLGARAELAEFIIGSGAFDFGSPKDLDFSFGLALTDADTAKPLVSASGYAVNAISLGLELSPSLAPVPSMELTGLVTPDGPHDAVNLLSASDVASAAESTLPGLILKQLEDMLGLTGSTPVVLAEGVATLLGVLSPKVDGGTWPADLVPPFSSGTAIKSSISDPVGAFADYYRNVLTASTPVAGRKAFTYIVEEIAELLAQAQGGKVAVKVTGEGTPSQPWTAALTVAGTDLPAYLTAWTAPATQGPKAAPITQLVIGMTLAPELTIGGTKIDPSLTFDLVAVDLPDDGSDAKLAGLWAPLIAAGLSLPEGFTSPEVAGATISIGASEIAGSWARQSGLALSLKVTDPVFQIDGQKIALGESLDFADPKRLEALVLQEAKAFLEMIPGLIGVALLRGGTGPGLAVAGLLGLLKDLDKASHFPKGLAWPTIAPLDLGSFADPFPAIRTQIGRALADDATAGQVLGLLGWALEGASGAAAPAPGSLSPADPYRLGLDGAPVDLLVWSAEPGKSVGLGLERRLPGSFTVPGGTGTIDTTTSFRLNVLAYDLVSGAITHDGSAPGLTVSTTISAPGDPLIPAGAAGELGRVTLGLSVTSTASGAMAVAPIVTLTDVRLPGESKATTLTFGDLTDASFAPRLATAAQALLNDAIDRAGRAAAGNALFTDFYALAADFGLALPRQAKTDPYGLNSGGWTGLAADPAGFATAQFETLLLQPKARDDLFKLIETLFGIKLPSIDGAILDVLQALGILGAADLGYPLRPDAIVSLLRDPFGDLVARAKALIGDTSAVDALQSRLAGVTKIPPAGPFTMQVANGNTIVLSIDPSAMPLLAGIVAPTGTITLDLATPAVTASVGAYLPALGLAPQASLGFHPAQTGPATADALAAAEAEIGIAIAFGDGTRPAPGPLILHGPGLTPLPDQLAAILPGYALSTIGGFLIETQLLAKYPLAQQVFEGLGLAQKIGGTWRMPALLGAVSDPRGWLLSEGILGTGGQFDVAGFAKWLSGLPAITGPHGLKITPQADGVALEGLPYGFGVALAGKDDVARVTLGAAKIDIADGSGTLENLQLGVSLGPSATPGVQGAMRIETAGGGADAIYADIGYDTAFDLTVGQIGSSTAPGLRFDILPYKGLGSLLEQAARQAPAQVLAKVVPILLTELEQAGAPDIAQALRKAGTDLDVAALVTAISQAKPFEARTVEAAALDWLTARMTTANAPKSAAAAVALLTPLFGTAVSSKGGLVLYTPSKSLPVTFQLGRDDSTGTPLLGLWADLDLPDLGRLRPRIERTGIGIPLSGPVSPVFSFGADVTVAFDGDTGPQLALGLDNGGLALTFDLMGSAAGGAPSPLARQLLPDFFPDDGSGAPLAKRVEDWAVQALTQAVPPYVAAILLNQSSVSAWMGQPLFGSRGGPSPAQVLTGSGVITDTGGTYSLVPFATLAAMTPEVFAAKFLRALLAEDVQVLTFGDKQQGTLSVGPDPSNPDAFGLRVVAADLTVPKLDFVTLQLGAEDTDWIGKSGGPASAKRGLGVYVPIPDGPNGVPTPHFSNLKLNFVNLGLDFTGRAGRPLVDFTRFKLAGVSPRTFVDLDLKGSQPPDVTFGVAGRLDDIAISVAPANVTPGDGGNPVAKNLLGSGEPVQDGDNSQATNPAFSVLGAYSTKALVELTRDGEAANPIMIPVQRSFGPLQVADVGFGWTQETEILDLIFDGGLALAGLSAQVEGLTVGIPVTTITDLGSYTLDLRGLGIEFQGGSVTIEGGLVKTTGDKGNIEYNGAAIVQASVFGLTALGSYTLLPTTDDPNGPTAPSLFIFGALQAPLGGIPAFFITGVAAGFGVNRALLLPDIGEVQDFPLLPGNFSGGDQKIGDVLAKLSSVVKPEIGQYWLGAGLTFTSFELIDGLALLFVQFGRRFEIDLLGLASAPLPKGLPKDSALAYIELALKATIIPEEGFISVEAQLTPNSYVLAKPCRLTGGFAFMLWLRDIEAPDGTPISAGQFVISLGGYHPAFKAPSYYPDIPRLGLEWLIDVSVGRVSITGGTYFALVPTAIMAGGYLKVLFEAGPLSAWLDASANFLVQWKPFYYSVEIGVSIGVRFKAKIGGISITISVSLGAKLLLMGPPTHGQADVSFYIVSFTIPIGSGKTETTPNKLTWSAFEDGFLPPDADSQPAPKTVTLELLQATTGTRRQPLKLAVSGGRLGGDNAQGGDWVVRAVPFTLRVDTVIPASAVTFAATATKLAGKPVGIRPMGAPDMAAPMDIAVLDPSGKPVDLAARGVHLAAIIGGAPSALWSRDGLDPDHAPDPKTMLVDGALLGTTLGFTSYLLVGDIPAFQICNLAYDYARTVIQLPFAEAPIYGPAPGIDQTRAITRMKATLMDPAVVRARNAALASLRAAAIDAPADPDLSVMADAADLIIQSPPVLAHPGVFQAPLPQAAPTGQRVAAFRRPVQAAPEPVHPTRAPELIARFRRDRIDGAAPQAHPALAPLAILTDDHFDPDPDETGADIRIRNGHATIHALDDRLPHRLTLRTGGQTRAVALDHAGAVLADRRVAGDGDWAVPKGSARLVLQNEGDRPSHVSGWQVDSPLLRLGPALAMGDGCLLRVQNGGDPRRASGTVEAGDLLAGNAVTGPGGQLEKGWIMTILPGAVRQAVVTTDLPPDQARRSVHLTWLRHTVPGLGPTDRLTPIQADAVDGGSRLIYDLPPTGDADGTALTLVTWIDGPAASPGRILSVRGTEGDGPAPDTDALRPCATDWTVAPKPLAVTLTALSSDARTAAPPLARLGPDAETRFAIIAGDAP